MTTRTVHHTHRNRHYDARFTLLAMGVIGGVQIALVLWLIG